METTFDEKPIIVGRGGYRPNAGRPRGAKNLLSTPKKAILEYTTTQELKNMVERAKKAAKRNDKMLQWYLEMCFGKPKVVEKESGKTVNNIALFLDKLEKEALNPPIVEDVNGQTTFGQILEDAELVHDQGPESEQDTVCPK